MPTPSRSRRSCAPSRIRSTVGPPAGAAPPGGPTVTVDSFQALGRAGAPPSPALPHHPATLQHAPLARVYRACTRDDLGMISRAVPRHEIPRILRSQVRMGHPPRVPLSAVQHYASTVSASRKGSHMFRSFTASDKNLPDKSPRSGDPAPPATVQRAARYMLAGAAVTAIWQIYWI